VDGRAVRISRPQQRAVLAYLLLNADRVVSAGQLVAALWGEGPPATARSQIQACVSRIRAALRETGGPAALSGDYVDAAAAGLDERRLSAYEELAAAELAAGRPDRLVAELRDLVVAYPLRERLSGQYMLALAGSGRQAEALSVYRRLRSRLDAELGVEPGAEVTEAYLRILRRQAAPAPREVGAEPTSEAEIGHVPTPAQLPTAVSGFSGRAAQLQRLDTLLAAAASVPAVVIATIVGTAGVGKTTLAVHWAHRVADRFPDGQLYVNLRGFAPRPADPLAAPGEALRGFLDALAVPPARIPATIDAQAALYRSVVAGRRVLVLLDNARDAEQVRPLLPGTPGCMAVVTSRDPLTGLVAAEGAHPTALDLLTVAEARDLMAGRIGRRRLAAEPPAIDEIIERCARLPLALAVVAARAATNPDLPLASLAAELRDARGGLGRPATDPATDIRAVFSWSYHTLGPDAARLFRLLGLHPGADLSTAAAASLAGQPVERVRALLAELTGAHLLSEPAPDRYAAHDLLRAYAAELAWRHDSDADRNAAVHRLLDHYRQAALTADRLLYPDRSPIDTPPPLPGVVYVPLTDDRQALAWFTTERPVLLAAVDRAAATGLDTHAWQLAWALATFLHRRGHWADWARVQEAAVRATHRLADPAGEAHARRLLGIAYHRLGRLGDAYASLTAALDLFAELDDRAAQGLVHRGLGRVAAQQNRHHDALGHTEHALDLLRAAGDRAGEAAARNAVGWYHAQLGDYELALTYCGQAAGQHQELGNRFGLANACDSLGYTHHRLGDHGRATHCYQEALTLFRELGDRYGEADTLNRLGDVHHAVGDADAAREAWQRAAPILAEIRPHDADQVHAKLRRLKTHGVSP
jgi:DNA-binding SARP family transcriptional activator/tetratricopeptide (TPR) repeat protein